MRKILLFGCAAFLILGACKRQEPQLPANKGARVDSAAIEMQQVNQLLTIKEDSLLTAYVAKQSLHFQKDELGFWYCLTENGTGAPIRLEETIALQCKLLQLDGTELKNLNSKIVVGKKQLIPALDQAVKKLKHGDKARLVVPWYLAYGMKGENEVPPYTSLVVQLSIY